MSVKETGKMLMDLEGSGKPRSKTLIHKSVDVPSKVEDV